MNPCNCSSSMSRRHFMGICRCRHGHARHRFTNSLLPARGSQEKNKACIIAVVDAAATIDMFDMKPGSPPRPI